MSDYPRIMYHADGHSAVCSSAHAERTEFSGPEWSRDASDKHMRDPGDGMLRTLAPAVAQTSPAPRPRVVESSGPVTASEVRAIIREELADHPGMNLDFDEVASAGDVERLNAKIDLLLKNLGVEEASLNDADEAPRRRRGRPPRVQQDTENRLTGAAGPGAEQE